MDMAKEIKRSMHRESFRWAVYVDGESVASFTEYDMAVRVVDGLKVKLPDSSVALKDNHAGKVRVTIYIDKLTLQQRIIQWWAERIGPGVSTYASPISPTDIHSLLGTSQCDVTIEEM